MVAQLSSGAGICRGDVAGQPIERLIFSLKSQRFCLAVLSTRAAIASLMADYADHMTATGTRSQHYPPYAWAYAGHRGARYWRRQLGEEARLAPDAGTFIRAASDQCGLLATHVTA